MVETKGLVDAVARAITRCRKLPIASSCAARRLTRLSKASAVGAQAVIPTAWASNWRAVAFYFGKYLVQHNASTTKSNTLGGLSTNVSGKRIWILDLGGGHGHMELWPKGSGIFFRRNIESD
jgi:hypothetical protein